MPPKVDKTPEQKLQEQQTTEMANIVTKIQRAAPTMIKLSNGKECEIESDLITRMYTGGKYSTTDWTKLSQLHLSVRAPRAVVSVGPAATLPALKDGETGYWIREVYTESKRLQWCVTVYKPSSRVVTTYAVRSVTCERSDLSTIASTLGTLPHMLSSVFHQETAGKDTHHVQFQDALLFDMLVDIATEDFTPHQRRIEDGREIQLEILQALEQLQMEAEAAAAAQPNKRRRTLRERLAQQTVKEEP